MDLSLGTGGGFRGGRVMFDDSHDSKKIEKEIYEKDEKKVRRKPSWIIDLRRMA